MAALNQLLGDHHMLYRLNWITLLLGLIIAPSLFAKSSGRLANADGQVVTQIPGEDEKPAEVGSQLPPGTRIRTGADGSAEIVFEDGSKLVLRSNSSMVLSKQKRQKTKKSSILLFFGRAWSKVNKAVGSDTKFEIKTANAVCGVRGTEFETVVASDGSIRVQVTEGQVGVAADEGEAVLDPGQEVEGNEGGINASSAIPENTDWDAWNKEKEERLRSGAKDIVNGVKGKIERRKATLEGYREEQEKLKKLYKRSKRRAGMGDPRAKREIAVIQAKLVDIADQIADLGDEAETQFGLVDHFADLAEDPRFGMIDSKYIKMEAENLRRVKKMLDKMVSEGTDISMAAMDQMLDDFRKGKRDTLKEKKGSSTKDLFGDDPF